MLHNRDLKETCAGVSESEVTFTKAAQAAVKLMWANLEQVTGPQENMRPRERNTEGVGREAIGSHEKNPKAIIQKNHECTEQPVQICL